MLKFKETTQNYPLITNPLLLTPISRFIPHFSHHRKSCFLEPFSTAKLRRSTLRGQGQDRFLDIKSAADFHENSRMEF